MKDTKDKRLTFTTEDCDQIAIAAAYNKMSAKKFMEAAVLSATIMAIAKYKKK